MQYLPSLLNLPPLPASHHSRSSQSTRLAPCATQQLLTSSLFYGASLVAHMVKNLPAVQATWSIPGSGRSPLHMIVNICRCYFLHSSHSLPPQLCPQVHSLHLPLHSFPENRFINTIFLDHIYIYIHTHTHYYVYNT